MVALTRFGTMRMKRLSQIRIGAKALSRLALLCFLSSSAAVAEESSFSGVLQCDANLMPVRIEPPRIPRSPDGTKELSGSVMLQFLVTEAGTVIEPVVIESAGVLLDRASLRAMFDAQFPDQQQRCVHQYRLTYVLE